MMFDLEKKIGQWLKELRKNPGFEDGDISEIEEHIRDSIDNGLDSGLSEKQAFSKAKALFGSMDLASDEMLKSRTDKVELPKPKKYLELSHPNSNNQLINASIMFNNYIKIALRNFSRNKLFSFINVSGLAIGMAACTLIFLWVQDEKSYDKFHDNSDRVYRIIIDLPNSAYAEKYTTNTTGPVITDLKAKYPEVIKASRFYSFENKSGKSIQYGDKLFNEKQFGFVDPDFFEMFTYSFLSGNPTTVFSDPGSALITESFAQKIFGEKDPLGETLLVDGEKRHTISGVIKDVPSNSHLKFNILVPFEQINLYIGQIYGDVLTRADLMFFSSYIMLENGVTIDDFREKTKPFLRETYEPDNYGVEIEQFDNMMEFQALTNIHLYSGDIRQRFNPNGGDIKNVKIFSIVAIFILLIACINFMNLTTARSVKRVKEVGLRKVFGGLRTDLIKQFYGESILLAFFALIIALAIVLILMPSFNEFSDKQLSLFTKGNLSSLFYLFFIALFTGIISGSYPALLLSAYKPTEALKGTSSGKSSGLFRKVMVILQFSVAIVLILSSYLVFNQYQYMQNRDLGFNKDHLVYVSAGGNLIENFDVLRNELINNSSIINASRSSNLLSKGYVYSWDFDWEGMAEDDPAKNSTFYYVSVDEHFVETCGMEMALGDNFLSTVHDSINQILVNEETAKLMNLESTIGTSARFGRITGVVKNYNFQSLRDNVKPLILWRADALYRYIYVKIRPENLQETLQYIEGVFNSIDPAQPFEYGFMDEALGIMYTTDKKMSQLLKYFTYLAIFIASLGLFGLVSYMIQQRRREIGIRKVLGCSVLGIAAMVNKEMIRCIVIANIISWPVVWYFMSQWLDQFAFRTDIRLMSFIVAGVIIFFISLVTVSYNSIKAGRMNPIESLRYE